MQEIGFNNVMTYIQSGNILFDSEETSSLKVREKIRKAIKDKYDFDVFVFAFTAAFWNDVLEKNPFIKIDYDLNKLYVCFLEEKPDNENLLKLNGYIQGEKIKLENTILYISYPDKISGSKLSNNFIENKLKVKATMRNWNTVLKIRELL